MAQVPMAQVALILGARWCYTDPRRGQESYAETI